jgi:hypothetical protein
VRKAIYDGRIFRLAASDASLRLVAAVVALLDGEFGTAGPNSTGLSSVQAQRQLQFSLPAQELYDRIGKVRKALVDSDPVQKLLFALIAAHGFELKANAIDPARLRAVADHGHDNPLAAPAYTAHRDTWYGNPQAQINWWMPLHDVTEGETFAFFPDYFARAVENNSQDFDYDRFMTKVGWQSTSGVQSVYPSAQVFDRSGILPFACQAGEIILFAASHLHQTEKNVSGATRLSVDFRTVHVDDQGQGLGAPNVDNRSTGSSLPDYVRP